MEVRAEGGRKGGQWGLGRIQINANSCTNKSGLKNCGGSSHALIFALVGPMALLLAFAAICGSGCCCRIHCAATLTNLLASVIQLKRAVWQSSSSSSGGGSKSMAHKASEQRTPATVASTDMNALVALRVPAKVLQKYREGRVRRTSSPWRRGGLANAEQELRRPWQSTSVE